MADSFQSVLTDLRTNNRCYVPWRCPKSEAGESLESVKVLFPGAFNPLHQGHIQMAAIAAQRTSLPIWFELCVNNIEKAAIDAAQLSRRVEQNFLQHGLLISCATKFIDKAALFPEVTFVVGADTLERIDAVRFYGHRIARDKAIGQLHDAGCRFLVFGRRYHSSTALQHSPTCKFYGADLSLSPRLRELCNFVSQDEFDEPISSSEIRKFEQNETDA